VKDTTRTFIILHLAVFLAGWTGVFGRIISLGGLPLVWYRIQVSVVTLALVLAVMGKLHKVQLPALLRMAGCGILLALHWTCFYLSIQASNISVGVACIATTCFFTAIFNPLLNRSASRIDWAEILISFISIAGVLLVFSLDVRYRVGIAWGLLSAAIYSVFAILNVKEAKRTGEDTATMLLWELVGGVLFLTLCMPLHVRLLPDASIVPTSRDLVSLLLLGSVFTVIPFLFQLQALRKLSAFTVNLTYNLEPVYSIVIAAILFDEIHEVGPSFWLGLFLIVVSVLLQTWRVSRKQ
jgi:drug/metabolite transporter (DMT)-like permease